MKSSPQALSPESLFDENSPEYSGQSSRIVRAPEREEREIEKEKEEVWMHLFSESFEPLLFIN